jgi:hypothetical protein
MSSGTWRHETGPQMDIIEEYVKSAPDAQHALNIFNGEWLSRFPPPFEHLEAGSVPLFQDSRITWAGKSLGGFDGANILELGPLEGGHSYMLEQQGAASVLAIEANRRAYMKCLIAKEICRLQRVQFILGDFVEFLRQSDQQFDICIASGVLYHMQNPVELLSLISTRADKLMLWTHYYDEAMINANPNLRHGHFGKRKSMEFADFSHNLYQLNYLESLKSRKFAGSAARFSHWMNRTDILAALKYFGYGSLEIAFENREHPHGPCFTVAATKSA